MQVCHCATVTHITAVCIIMLAACGRVRALPATCPPQAALLRAASALAGGSWPPFPPPARHPSGGWVRRLSWLATAATSPLPTDGAYDPDKPYPIWFFDPDGSAYAALLSVARTSSGMLEGLHDVTGLPWWGTIVAGAFLIRAVFFPLNAYSLRNASRFFDAKDDIQQLRRAHRTAMMSLGTAATSYEKFSLLRVYMKGVKAALHKHNCYPARTFAIPFMITPFFFASVLGARHLVFTGNEEFETGGLWWWSDLTVTDPHYILPVVAMSMSYLLLDIGFGTPKTRSTITGGASMLQGGVLDRVRSFFQMAVIAGAPLIVHLPAGIFVGWIASSVWSIAYIRAIRSQAVYKAVTGRDLPRRTEEDEGEGVGEDDAQLCDVTITAPAAAPRGADVDAPAAAPHGVNSDTEVHTRRGAAGDQAAS